MAVTKIANVIVPAVFMDYVRRQTMELSDFWQSGIIGVGGAELGGNLTSGGNTINMPFWTDLSNADEGLSDSVGLTVNQINAKKDMAVLHFRGGAWGSNDLAHQLAGDDPMKAIASFVAGWWSRQMQRVTLSTLKGAFASASMSSNVLDISAAAGEAANINAKTFISATQKLGDAKAQLMAMAMHSAVQASLAQQDLIDTERDSSGRVLFDTFMGKRIIIDDGMPNTAGVYTTYVFGAGAIGYNEGGVLNALETDRDIIDGNDFLTTRRAFVLHPRGISWTGSAVGATPTLAELETGTNWNRVFESKAIPIVQFKHKIALV